MRNPLGGGNAMTAHISGTSIDSQIRYANGTKDIIKRFLSGQPQEPQNLIVTDGDFASKAYGERTKVGEAKQEVRTDGKA